MKKTLYLAKILHKCGSGLAGSDYYKKQKASNIVAAVFGVLIAVGLFFLGKNLNNLSILFGDPYIVMLAVFVAGEIANIVFEIPGLISTLYMGQDNYILLGLPYSPVQIAVARVLSSLTFPLSTAAIAVFPIGIGYAVDNGVTIELILALILAFISIIVISMSFDMMIVIVFISLVKVVRNRDSLRTIGAILLLVIVGAWIFFCYNGFDEKTALAVTKGLSNVLWILPVNFAILQIFKGVIALPFIETIVIDAAFVALSFLLAKLLFLNSVLKMQDTANGNKIVGDKEYRKLGKKTSIEILVAKRDFYLTSRNPAHITNSYLFPLVIPIIIVVALIMSSINTFLVDMPIESTVGSIFMASYITPMITLMGSALGAISYTCISREGSSFDMLRILPVPFEKIIKGKAIVSYAISAIPIALICLITSLVGVAFFNMKAYTIPYVVVYSLLLSIFAIDRNMVRDMKSPNLVWDNEGLMIKNAGGFRSVLIMFVGMWLSGLSVAVCMTEILLPYLIPFNIVISALLAFLAHRSLKKWTKKVGAHLNM